MNRIQSMTIKISCFIQTSNFKLQASSFSAWSSSSSVQALRAATNIACMTTVVSIYQAGQLLYDLFDKVRLFNKKNFQCHFINIQVEYLIDG